MIHFIAGLSSKSIYLEDLLKKLNIDNIVIFDDTNSDLFLSELNSGSLFSEPKIVMLKNADKVKNIQTILDKLSKYDVIDEEVIIVYDTNKENKKIWDIAKNFNTHFVFDDKLNKKNFLQFISNRLNINNFEANQLLDLLDENYYLISNEIDKIENYLNGTEFSFDKVKEILSKNSKFIIFDITNSILNKKEINFPIKEHMGVLASLTNDFDVLYKLHVSKVRESNYNNFKEAIKYYTFLDSYSPYYLFKKQEFLDKFSKKDTLKFLNLAFETELKIKTGEIDLEIGVENFIMSIYTKKN